MSGAPEEQEQDGVDETPSTVIPAIISYLRDEGLESLSADVLETVHNGILESLCTDLRMTDFNIRKEAYILCCVIHHHLFGDLIPSVPADFDACVKEIIGTSIDNSEPNKYIRSHILSRGADKDDETYNMAIGRMLAVNSCTRMQQYSYSAIEPHHDIVVVQRLCDMMTRYSIECKFERTKDLYLHQIARSHLCCERISLINSFGYQSNPLRQISEYILGDTLTDLITPIIKRPVDEIMASIDWKTESSNHVFILFVSLLQEMMDNHRLLLLTNTHVPLHESTNEAQLFIITENCSVVSAGYGIIKNKKFVVVDAIEYPIAHLLLQFIKIRSQQPNNEEYRQLLMCCEKPNWVSASNPFVRLI